MVFFIPWRVVAEESGAAHFGFGGAMLLDVPGPALRLLTDVADSHFSDIAVRGDDGRSGDRSERATGSTPPTPLIESRVDWVCDETGLHSRFGRADCLRSAANDHSIPVSGKKQGNHRLRLGCSRARAVSAADLAICC